MDDGRFDSTWPVWPAEVKAGFSSFMPDGSPSTMPQGIEDAPYWALRHAHEGRTLLRSRRNVVSRERAVSPDGKSCCPDTFGGSKRGRNIQQQPSAS